MDVRKLEYKFGTQLIQNLMQKCGIDWSPENMSIENNESFPLTLKIQKAMEMKWIEKSSFVFHLFDTAKDMGSVNLRVYEDSAKFTSQCFLEDEFSGVMFLDCLAIISGLAAVFFRNGVPDAPYSAVLIICETIGNLKERGVFDDDSSWSQMDEIAEAYVSNQSQNKMPIETDGFSSQASTSSSMPVLTAEGIPSRAQLDKELPQASCSKSISRKSSSIKKNTKVKHSSTKPHEIQSANLSKTKSNRIGTCGANSPPTLIPSQRTRFSDGIGAKDFSTRKSLPNVPHGHASNTDPSVATVSSAGSRKNKGMRKSDGGTSSSKVANAKKKNLKYETSLSNSFQRKLSIKDKGAADDNCIPKRKRSIKKSKSSESEMIDVNNLPEGFTQAGDVLKRKVKRKTGKSKIPVKVQENRDLDIEIIEVRSVKTDVLPSNPPILEAAVLEQPPSMESFPEDPPTLEAAVPADDPTSKKPNLRPRTFIYYAED